MNWLHFASYLGVGVGFPAVTYLARKKLTSGPRMFAAFLGCGVGFSMLNLGPLGVILGSPSILMSSAFCAYLMCRR